MIRFFFPCVAAQTPAINPCSLDIYRDGLRAMSLGTWGAIAGAAISVGGALLTKKKAPDSAAPANVNLQDQQSAAIAGNTNAEGNIETLLSKANNYTQNQAIDLMNKAVPGYTSFANQLLATGQKKLDNPYALPQDVEDNLTRISAERGISRGTRGQTNDYSALRDLGVNMLDYGDRNFQQAMQALTTVTGTAPRISPMSPMSFYVTPAQNAQVAAGNASNLQATQQANFNNQAAASNFNNQNLWDSISRGTGQALGAYLNRPQTQPSTSPYDGANPRITPTDPNSATGGNF